MVSVRGRAALHGPEAVAVVERGGNAAGCHARIHGGSAWPYQPLHASLWVSEETWRRDGAVKLYDHRGRPGAADSSDRRPPWVPLPPPYTVPRLATIVGFASREFFHFLMEALPRLALLLPRLHADASMRLAVPALASELSATAPTGFLPQLLRLVLPPDWFDSGRLLPYSEVGALPGARAVATEALLMAEWTSARDTDAPSTPTHCLTPASALRAARALVARSVAARSHLTADGGGAAGGGAAGGGAAASGTPRAALVFAARRGVSMRSLRQSDEDSVIEGLRGVAAAHDADLVVFDGSAYGTIEDAIRLFGRAAVVVGVHGGALSNILFCPPGATLIELGVRSHIARHFEHAAAALSLRYVRVHLEADSRGVGARNVSLGAEGIDAVGRAAQMGLSQLHMAVQSLQTRSATVDAEGSVHERQSPP